MTIVNKKMNIDQYDILYARLDQTYAVLSTLAEAHRVGVDNTGSALGAPVELLRQARDALEGLFVESEAT